VNLSLDSEEKDMRFVLCILLLAAWSSQASEPSKGWSAWLSEGQALRDAGDYSAAAHTFREALTIAERSSVSDPQLIALDDALAETYAEAGQFAESEAAYRRALSLVAKTEGQASLDYAVLLASMAVLPTQTVVSEEQIVLLRNAIAMHAREGSAQKLAIVRGCLALILKKQKRYQEEESLLVEALANLSSQKAPNPHLMGAFLNDLAMLRLEQGRHEESIGLQQKSIRLLEEALGQEHPSLVVPFNNLATTYVKVGRFADAGLTYQRAIDICRKTLSEDHLDYAVLLENYAVVLRKLGRKREAKKADAEGQQIERAADRHNGVGLTIGVTALRSDPPTLQR
jgi:tetratricopeptide (TPR) repeat protein